MNIEEVEALLKRIDLKQSISSVEFGLAYTFITKRKYVYTNCGPCFKDQINEIKNGLNHLNKIKLAEIVNKEKCIDCEKNPTFKKAKQK